MNRIHPSDDLPEQSWDIDEPAYGEGPLEPFKASYEIEGTRYTARIQAFFKENEKQSSYRTTYPDGTTRIIDYQLGVGFIEERLGQTPHATAIGECIQERFGG